jgi:hypothetical protein
MTGMPRWVNRYLGWLLPARLVYLCRDHPDGGCHCPKPKPPWWRR